MIFISSNDRTHYKKIKRAVKFNKSHKEFSKVLLIQESILIWIMTLSFIGLAYYCVINEYFGELPWLAAMVAFPWGAYGMSQAFYYDKSKHENTKDGIKFETTMASITNNTNNSNNNNNSYNTINYNNSYNTDTNIDNSDTDTTAVG